MNHDLYKSGFVQRWHTHPNLARLGQTLGHHQWGVATIIAQLHPKPSVALLMAALWHDVGESVSGDIPHMAKHDSPALAYEAGRVEDTTRERLTGWILADMDSDWLHMADRLEAYLYVQTMQTDVLDHEDWFNCLEDILETAERLGVYDDVLEVLG